MWIPLLTAIVKLLTKTLETVNSPQFQAKVQEHNNAKRENEARKALVKKDAALVAAITADQHDRVLAVCGSAGRGKNPDQRAAVGPDAGR